MDKIKVCFVIDELSVGGTERQVVKIANNLSGEKFSPTICVLKKHPLEKNHQIDCNYINIGWEGIPIINRFFLVYRLHQFFLKENFDIIFTYFPEAEIHSILAVKLLKKKPLCIGNRRNLNHWINNEKIKFFLIRLLSRYNDYILTNSYKAQEVCSKSEKIDKSKIHVIHNAVDVAQFDLNLVPEKSKEELGFSPSDFIVGVVGNWRPVKGLETFLLAASEVNKKNSHVKYLLAGHGPQRDELIKLAEKLEIKNNVYFFENYEDIPKLMSVFDVAVQPSYSESFSNVWVEYMASGLPIIATKTGDAENVFQHEHDGVLVEPDNAVQLCKAIDQLIHDRIKSTNLGGNAKLKAACSWATGKIIEKYQLFIFSVLNK